ncbi:MAG: metallophosphoesterase [Kiritimatiellales bacterium]|nr:metallophosphoesterase [Kiritimatiellales bacterium]
MKRFFLFILIWLTAGFAVASEPVFFVQLTDTHFGSEESFERGRSAVEAINALPMDISFVVVTGDIMQNCITDSNQVNRVFQTLGKLNAPLHFVPGNHDLLKDAPEQTMAAFTNRFGPLISSVQCGGVDFVFVCTEPLSGGVQISGYDPLKELDALLGDRPAVVFNHVPSADDFYSNQVHNGWRRSATGRQWTEILNRHSVLAVIAGHFHRDEQDWIGAVPLFVATPLSEKAGRQGTFRIYEIEDGRIRYRTQYLD